MDWWRVTEGQMGAIFPAEGLHTLRISTSLLGWCFLTSTVVDQGQAGCITSHLLLTSLIRCLSTHTCRVPQCTATHLLPLDELVLEAWRKMP